MRQRRCGLAPEERARASRTACGHLLSLSELAPASPGSSGSIVGVYVAMGAEIDPADALPELERRGITLVHPRTLIRRVGTRNLGTRVEHTLTFHRVPDPAELVRSPFGVLEPRPEHPLMPIERIDAIVVPGLAFDRHGARLGWGKGYYDTALAKMQALRIGFAYHSQILDQVPAADHDALMDILVTDAGAERITHRARRGGPEIRPDDP